jgi:hypothetical protein
MNNSNLLKVSFPNFDIIKKYTVDFITLSKVFVLNSPNFPTYYMHIVAHIMLKMKFKKGDPSTFQKFYEEFEETACIHIRSSPLIRF